MLGPIGANLMSILRVLTPSEIEMYTYSNKHEVNRAIAVGAENINYDEHQSSYREEYKPKSNNEDDLHADEQNHHKAKIIPINQHVELQLKNNEIAIENEFMPQESSPSDHFQSKQKNHRPNELNEIGILSASQVREIEERKRRDQDKKKDSTSVFILNQRDKFKNSRLKLIEQKAILEYQKNSNTEIMAKQLPDDDYENNECTENTSKGILVNKKHY